MTQLPAPSTTLSLPIIGAEPRRPPPDLEPHLTTTILTSAAMPATVGVLALQGGFQEHLSLLRRAAPSTVPGLALVEVRTPAELARCDALVIPGGESTTISLVAAQSGLLEPLRDFVRVARKPVWGTCAGAILLADEANASSVKKGGQELIGGLAVRVHRNHFGRQIESFVSDLDLPFLAAPGDPGPAPFPGVFIRAPVVEAILSPAEDPRGQVEVLAVLPGRKSKAGIARPSESDAPDELGDIVAVRQGNIFATSFHPELTEDTRIHAWWLGEVIKTKKGGASA
jgi:pyridoxal 5'-phosphate synthase pdxT subunit